MTWKDESQGCSVAPKLVAQSLEPGLELVGYRALYFFKVLGTNGIQITSFNPV